MIYKFVLLLLISRYHYEFGNLVLGALAFVLICYLSILLINSLLYHNQPICQINKNNTTSSHPSSYCQFAHNYFPMLFVYFVTIFCHLLTQLKCGECDMSAIISFQDCVYFCLNKYGENQTTQRKYYNRFTGNCEKAVICTDTPFRAFENRCLRQFEYFLIGNQAVSLPQIYQQIIVIMVHGNFNAIDEKDMCYPGFFSSKKRIKIGVQVYQQYYCDMPIGTDPATYPSSHGEYFFYQLDISSQVNAVKMDCPCQMTFDLQYSILLSMESLFMVVVFHYHLRLCRSCIRKRFKSD